MGPATVTEEALLTAARVRSTASSLSISPHAAASARIAAMPPRPRVRCCARLRAQTTRAAASSPSAPEAQAAAISPTLWPTKAVASTPALRSASTAPTCTANNRGWATSVRVRSWSAGSPSRRASTDQPRWGARAASARATPRRKAGLSRRASEPMPAHWEPLPEKTKARLPWTASPVTASEDTGSRPATSSAGLSPASQSRWR